METDNRMVQFLFITAIFLFSKSLVTGILAPKQRDSDAATTSIAKRICNVCECIMLNGIIVQIMAVLARLFQITKQCNGLH